MATPASESRRTAAERVAPVYAAIPKVAAVLLSGSTARGYADRFSDVELGVFWHEPPSDEERLHAIEQAGGELEQLYPLEDGAWCDDWKLGRRAGEQKSGLSIDMVHQTTAMLEEAIAAVVERHDPDPLKQNTISGFLDGVALHGRELVGEWRRYATSYPDELATAVVRHHGQLSHFWRFRMLAARDNRLHAYKAIVWTHETLLHLLLAVNRVYYFGFKWLDAVVDRVAIAPADFDARLRRAYALGADADRELRPLVEEVYDLVELHVPGVDVDRLRLIFRYERPLWGGEPVEPVNRRDA